MGNYPRRSKSDDLVTTRSTGWSGGWSGRPVEPRFSLLIGVAAGVLPDADHLIDFYNWYVRGNRRKWLLLLRGWEYLLIAVAVYFVIGTPSWLLAVVLGYATQIVADQIANPSYWHTYSITPRALKKFDRESITPNDPVIGYEALVRSIQFGRERVRKWFADRVESTSG